MGFLLRSKRSYSTSRSVIRSAFRSTHFSILPLSKHFSILSADYGARVDSIRFGTITNEGAATAIKHGSRDGHCFGTLPKRREDAISIGYVCTGG